MSNSDDDQLYSIGEACGYLGVSRNTLAYLRHAGYLKSYYNGRNVRFLKGDLRILKLWYEQQKHKKRSS